MKTLKFCTSLAPRMEGFVSLRRLAGTDYQSQIRLLVYFDHFLMKQNFKAQFLSREIIERYLTSLSQLAPRTQYNRFSVLSQFCRYLSQFEPLCYVPEAMGSAKSSPSRIAYIYTKEEIQSLLSKASKLSPPSSLRPHTYYTLFGLLYTTGIRIGEALALDINDLSLNTQRLHIREGKFRKARWVPLSPSTCVMLRKYIDKRQDITRATKDAPLFISLRYKRLHHSTVSSTLRSLLEQCDIHAGPRIHDFRHTFAVHRLLQWYREALDVNARLPALATYMGHVDVSSTHIYLQATPELFEEANKRFLKHYRQHIKNQGGQS
jgi:site-specific recombinase XerD